MELKSECKIFNNRRETAIFLAFLIGFSAIFRFTVAVGYYSEFDTFWYKNWAVDIARNGLFDIYSRAKRISLDYPPMYLFCLAVSGGMYSLFGINCDAYTQMFIMKFWPVVFDCIMIWALYKICSKYSEKAGIAAALLWAFNPSVIFNTCFWGQTDQLMALLLVISFVLAERDRPVLSCIVFAVCGLTKYQTLYFTPVLLLYIFYESGFAKLLKGIYAALGTVVVVFLPFMIGAHDPLLFFKVYLGGANTYPYCTLNAFNLYGALRIGGESLNWMEETTAILGPITFSLISKVFLVLSVLLVVVLFIFAKRRSGFVGGLLIMQCIFMLTVRQHERYQIAVLPFALMAYFTVKDKRFLKIFVSLSVMTLINQVFVLFSINGTPFWERFYDTALNICSAVNIFLFAYSVYVCINWFLKDTVSVEKAEEVYDLHE